MPHIPGQPTAGHERNGSGIDWSSKIDEQSAQATDRDWSNLLRHGSVDLPLTEAGEPGLTDYKTRFHMARGHGYQEKANEFLLKYPDGQLGYRQFPGDTELKLGFKKSDDDPWSKVDAPFLRKNDILGDLVDFAGSDLAEIVGEVGMVVGRKGQGLPQLLARIFGGNVLGSTVGELHQWTRGTQEETVSEWMPRTLGKAAVSTTAAGGVALLQKGYQVAKGGGLFKTTPGGAQAIQAAERLGVPVPPVHFLTDHPWLRKIGAQSAAVLPGVDEYVMTAREATKNVLKRLSSGTSVDTLARELATIESTLRHGAIRVAEEGLGLRPLLDVRAVGENLKTSIDEYDAIAKQNVAAKYTIAQRLDEPLFDLSGLRSKSQVILNQELGAKRIIEKTAEPSPLILPPGVTAPRIVTEAVAEGRGVTTLVDPEVRAVYKEISETLRLEPRTIVDDSTGQKIIITPTDQLNLWAERLGPYTFAQDGVTKRTHNLATKGYALLRDILDKPNNLETTPGFGAAWRTARQAARDRFETLRKVGAARTSDEPIQYLRNAYGAKSYEKLQHLKKAMPEGRWLELQNSYMLDLIESNNINNLTKTLGGLDAGFRGLLLGREGNRVLTELGHHIDELNHLGVQKLLSNQVTYRSIIGDLADSTSSADIATVRKMIDAGGGFDSPLGKNIRTGILEHVYESALVDEAGTQLLNKTILHSIIKSYKKTGAYNLLPRKDWATLLDLSVVESVYTAGSDAGTSLLGAEVASKMGHVATALTNPKLWADVLKAKGWGRVLISGPGRRFLVGDGTTRVGVLKKLAVINSIIAKAIMEDKEIAGDIERYVQEHGS